MNDTLDDIEDRDPTPLGSAVEFGSDLLFWFILATFWSAAFVFSCLFWLWLASRIAAAIRG
jgi:hypothetical protein